MNLSLKYLSRISSSIALMVYPGIAFAIDVPPRVLTLMGKIYVTILNPIILLLFVLALGYFTYGVVKFVWNADDEGERATGKAAIFWGIVGMFIMFSVYGILNIIISTIGADPLVNV